MQTHILMSLGKGWIDSIGLVFAFVILLPALITALVVVSIISGRGEKAQNAKHAGRWGQKPPS